MSHTPYRLFIAYSRKDTPYLQQLRTHLAPLERAGQLQVWYDGLIEAGDNWEGAIKKNLAAADLILLLVSPDSLASDYFYGREVSQALDRHRRGEARVAPLILRPCIWQRTPLGELQALPRDGRPVSAWSDPDEAYHDATERLIELLDAAASKRLLSPQTAANPSREQRPQSDGSLISTHMVRITGSTFQMGDTLGEGKSREKPVHTVTVSDFYLGRHEVTFAEYDPFCAATGRTKPSDQSWGRGHRPAINVSWLDAVAYCNWRSGQEGLTPVYTINGKNVTANWDANGYRLPTEAEWEYAARGGGQQVRFGDGRDVADPARINFKASADYKKDYSLVDEYRRCTVPVGSLNAPNALGLHDMSGNVWEWCWDWFGSYPSGAQTNPRGPGSGPRRVMRGGSWRNDPAFVRAAFRHNNSPGYKVNDLGFRLARAVR